MLPRARKAIKIVTNKLAIVITKRQAAPSPNLASEDERALVFRETLALTGAVASSWSLFERAIDVKIWREAKIDPDIGACITSQIQSVRQKLITLETILNHLSVDGSNDELIKKIRRIQNAAEEPARLRNRIVHNPIYINFDKETKRWRLTADRRLVFEDETISHDEMWALIDRINSLYDEFKIIFSRDDEPL